MKTKQLFLSLLLALTLSGGTFAQNEDLHLFGYFQNNFTHFETYSNGTIGTVANSFLMQQMNVLMQKNLNAEFSSFINLEFTNSFSSKDSMGGLKVQEAWIKYSPSTLLNIKAGLLVPRFNNLNEIKNRTVLLPYIYRPFAYETYFIDQYGTGDFAPNTANVQVYGDIPVSELYINYAVFMGNSETSLLNKNSNFWGAGQDPTKYKLFGGRLGVEYGDLQAGVSGTMDRKDLNAYHIGLIPRTRLGAYLNYSLAGFDLEAEYIKVTFDLSDQNKDTLRTRLLNAPKVTGGFSLSAGVPQNFDKSFSHVNLTYNALENLGIYAGYDYLTGDDNIFIKGGRSVYTGGAFYKVISSIILKAQITHQEFTMGVSKSTRNDYLLGASVSF